MKYWLAVAALLTVTILHAASGVASKVTYIPHDKVSAAMAKGERIIEDNGLVVIAQRRAAGDVEIHEKTNHVFIIVEGEATFVTGGTAVDARQTAPDQRRARASKAGGPTT
jgi:mannose-6-phosphate isomerase-like protein (cupin superfamily)